MLKGKIFKIFRDLDVKIVIYYFTPCLYRGRCFTVLAGEGKSLECRICHVCLSFHYTAMRQTITLKLVRLQPITHGIYLPCILNLHFPILKAGRLCIRALQYIARLSSTGRLVRILRSTSTFQCPTKIIGEKKVDYIIMI